MSKDWVGDINDMQTKFRTRHWVNDRKNADKLAEFLDFRIKFLQEELLETQTAVANKDPEEVVDGLIDLCVVAIGTLDAFAVDPYKAWETVLDANMSKSIGIKPSRPNKLGVPDLVKPDDWAPPSHTDNHGILPEVFKN